MTSRTCRLIAVVGAVVPALFTSCKKKEEPPQQVSRQEAPPSLASTTTTLPPPTPVPRPPPVWRAARWGMTTDEVLKGFPGEAQRLAVPAAFSQPQEGSTLVAGTSDLGIPVYEDQGAKFRVLFGFESGVLHRIHLAAAKAGPATCGDLEQLLTKEHSEPSSRNRTGTTLKGEEIVWKRPDRTITLVCAGVPTLGFQSVALDYMAPRMDLATK